MASSSFPVGSKVILQNLVKGAQYNGMKGTVKSVPDPTTSRQNIYVHAANKCLAIKPINLKHEPRELTSLSIEEMTSLLRYVKKRESKEMIDVLHLQATRGDGAASNLLQTLVRDRVTECPNELARLLTEMKAEADEVNAKILQATKDGPSCEKEKLSPSAYLKGRYKQNASRDAKEEMKACCNKCGKTNVNLLKCGRCLSVFYCSKECQKTDHVTHKKECKRLLQKRIEASANDVDIDMARSGEENVPRIGVALSESVTGLHGEVLCHLPCWLVEGLTTLPKSSRMEHKPVARSVRYFFKVYQSSVEAAKSLSLSDVGGLCQDALLLLWMKHPGVRRVYAEEATSGEFTLQFLTQQDKPDGWSIVGFEDRLAKLLE